MRTLTLALIAPFFAAVVLIVANSLLAANHESAPSTMTADDPMQLTLSAGPLPVIQVNEPF